MFRKENCRLTEEEINEKANSLLEQMTLKEKVWLLNGNYDLIRNLIKYRNPYNPVPFETNGCKRLGVNPIKFTDGPRGVVMGKATCFPVSMARGASFDRSLEKRVGDAIAKEARALGANYFAGVCINLLRHPAWGRAQETYGEDPFHVGEMGKELTEIVQEHNVMACIKHYAVNNIENSRFRVNVKSDERTLREVYLPHFKKSIDVGAASVMGAYNLYEGDHCCESDLLLNQILRKDWGFEGFTLSDFIFGIRNTAKAIKAGMDVEMPLPLKYQKFLLEAVEKGEVSEETVNLSALRILKTLLVFENSPEKMEYSTSLVAQKEHTELAKEVAEKSMVLIKNENQVLPLSKDVKEILVIGKLANKPNTGDHGSSRIRPPYVVTPLQGLKNEFGDAIKIHHCEESEIEKAKDLASKVDAVIIVAGNDFNDEGEFITPSDDPYVSPDLVVEGTRNQGMKFKAFLIKMILNLILKPYRSKNGEGGKGGDRQNLSLKSDMIKLIQEVGSINPKTVVSLIGGSMIMTKEWDDKVPAILYSWYSGMEGGNALAKILFGEVNPSGKLPFIVPKDEKDLPYFSSTDKEITYDLYHGYTLLDKNNIKAHYPFGFGLSYTTWKYGSPKISHLEDTVKIEINLENTGKREGEEVVQVYVGVKDSKIERQKKLLKGFEKVALKAGENQNVTVNVPLEELRYFDENTKQWTLEKGMYQFYVGSSADEADLQMIETEIN